MHFFVRAAGNPRKLGVFPGSYNPPTRAHAALARAALSLVDEVLLVIPRAFPHKPFEGASFEQRIEMLRSIADPRFSIAAANGGLFIEIARECREAYYPVPELSFLCGRDAAERIVSWDYGHPEAASRMLEEFELLVAARDGAYQPPPGIAHRVHSLPVTEDSVSATEVRQRIRHGLDWEHLVPAEIAERVQAIYS